MLPVQVRINKVAKARKDHGNCSKCNTPIVKGSAYRWIKSGYDKPKIRCMRSKCSFTPSELAVTSREAHRFRHKQLHIRLDELWADYLQHNPHSTMGNTTVRQLLEWSSAQCENPSD
jgi:hypothetical protein